MVITPGDGGEFPVPEVLSKHEILYYLVNQKNLLLHGSNQGDIELLEPKEQRDYNGNLFAAVFATQDAVWQMFFAVLDQANFQGSIRNGCFVVTDHRGRCSRYYFFSISEAMHQLQPWTDGMVCILPHDPFFKTSRGVLRFDEWACESAVQPLAKIPISPKDFLFLSEVTPHDKEEPLFLSWLRYRSRLKT